MIRCRVHTQDLVAGDLMVVVGISARDAGWSSPINRWSALFQARIPSTAMMQHAVLGWAWFFSCVYLNYVVVWVAE